MCVIYGFLSISTLAHHIVSWAAVLYKNCVANIYVFFQSNYIPFL